MSGPEKPLARRRQSAITPLRKALIAAHAGLGQADRAVVRRRACRSIAVWTSVIVWSGLGRLWEPGCLASAADPPPGAPAVLAPAAPPAVPPVLPSTPAARAALVELLLVADVRSSQAASQADRKFQAAIQAGVDERLARYAHAVVLFRLLKSKEAIEQLSKSAGRDHDIYPLAYRGWLMSLLTTKQFAPAMTAARDFASVMVTDPPVGQPAPWGSLAERKLDIEWLGRAVAAGQSVAPTPVDVQRWSQTDLAIRDALTESLRDSYQIGFEAALRDAEALSESVAESRIAGEARQAQERELQQDALKDQKGQAAANRENLKLTAEEWKKKIDSQLVEFGKQVGKLEQDYNVQDQRRASLERSIILVNQELNGLNQRLQQAQQNNGNNGRPTNQNQINALQLQIAQREQTLLNYRLEHDRTTTLQAQLAQQATLVLRQRQLAIADYERATGNLIQQDAKLKQLQEKLTKQEKQIAEAPTRDTAATKAIDAKRKSVTAYLPWDWEAERQRLLAEFRE